MLEEVLFNQFYWPKPFNDLINFHWLGYYFTGCQRQVAGLHPGEQHPHLLQQGRDQVSTVWVHGKRRSYFFTLASQSICVETSNNWRPVYVWACCSHLNATLYIRLSLAWKAEGVQWFNEYLCGPIITGTDWHGSQAPEWSTWDMTFTMRLHTTHWEGEGRTCCGFEDLLS